ncbi:PREDICTED: epidermal retinol dehydrogenase 2-like [Gavialis gangeticus]|uniref:epidermal retinol dehydrogenase 2-like n=1 Tax=Gavialis gangeticus TaxID=94835 RepID=UPI00092E2368|nr:PREDICTED: epidermal retinol dehydrogenase 2-like [Gavialis gangeticus]
MKSFLKMLKVLVLSIYYLLEALVRCAIPRRKKNVTGEIVLITGAGSGIGRLMALKFACLGAVLVLWDVNQEGNKETGRLAKEAGAVKVHTYICDCSKRQEVYKVADQVKKEVGDVSILINNAGIVTGSKFLDCPDSLVEKSMAVNAMAHFWTYKAFLPAMIASNHGHLVSIASSTGLHGTGGLADYAASKFAAVGFAESIDVEMRGLKKTGIKTTIVCPYFINTGMFDGIKTKSPRILPILDPEYTAEAIVKAILQEQLYLMIPRSLYVIIALTKILPTKTIFLWEDYFGAYQSMDYFHGQLKKD